MMEDFPVPDFDFDDFDDTLVERNTYTATSSLHFKFGINESDMDNFNKLSGLTIDFKDPIRVTANSIVFRAQSKLTGQDYAVKISNHKKRILKEYINRSLIKGSAFIIEYVSFYEDPTQMFHRSKTIGFDERHINNSIDLPKSLIVSQPKTLEDLNLPPNSVSNHNYSLLLMELAPNGDIKNKQYSEDYLWKLIHDVAAALHELHSNNFMHLDVSPSNILLMDDKFKLSDFGTMERVGNFREGCEGAGPYVSPEALNYPFGPYPVTQKTDIFSFAVVLLEAATGKQAPRGGSDGYSLLRKEKIILGDQNYPCSCHEKFIEVVNLMLSNDPSKRPSAEQLIQLANSML